MRLSALVLALAVAALALPGAAAPGCALPKGLAPAPVAPVRPDEVESGVTIAYYLLAITWTPDWRRINGQTPATTPPLDPERRPQGFALHGLWPNGKAPPYPRYCRPVGTIPLATVRAMYCRTPSAGLLQHEWQAHGACGWDDPAAYFRQAAKLYDRVTLPRIEGVTALTAGDLRRAFMAKNRWLAVEDIYVQADRDGRLTEVRLCYDLADRPAACPAGVGAPDDRRVGLTPSTSRRF
ncbi:ribonuclease T [Phenylobacterium sp.]|uniref:ribonuclease T2 family protein n=1 Tax=Phenylobacterium sp. TaxID=1871053 RepID=UPI0025E9839F|nr:ribonuclease T [Phenylobacterium sp.]